MEPGARNRPSHHDTTGCGKPGRFFLRIDYEPKTKTKNSGVVRRHHSTVTHRPQVLAGKEREASEGAQRPRLVAVAVVRADRLHVDRARGGTGDDAGGVRQLGAVQEDVRGR